MSSPADKIASLEAEIEGYQATLAASADEARKDKLLDLITERCRTLNLFLSQQQGKHINLAFELLLCVCDGF